MKLIRSVVRPSKLDEIKEALSKAHVLDMTVIDVMDHAPQNAHMALWRTLEYKLDAVSRSEIHVVVEDDDVDQIVSMILRTARTTGADDGHVSVMPVEQRYDIHSGERVAL